ncbi:MAG: RloB family protein [Limisphaerales bacterium]
MDELWLVVDRDAWTESDLNDVVAAIGALPKYHLALSNPCFELWLVLHRRDAPGQNGEQLRKILKAELGAYEKSSYNVEALRPTIDDAIRRAERLDASPKDPWPRVQGTHVYRLVKRLMAR